uniref:Uncharacterized protein n=1 Tax=Magallana gigas TaxID=29159 RepID=A0A8W8P4Z4_MAGGI
MHYLLMEPLLPSSGKTVHARSRSSQNKSVQETSAVRKLLQPTKKMNCPTSIHVKAVLKFPEFEGLSAEGPPVKNLEIHITLPDPGDHRNHLPGEISRLSQPLDEAVISKTHGLVHDGVRSIDEMKRHLRLFVQEHNQTEDTTISELNRRYYPTNKDIRHHMYRTLRFYQFSTEDQENTQHMVKEWEAANPAGHFYLRPHCLQVVKEWNPDWNPKYFMTDFDEREVLAVKNTFKDCESLLLCDFHREQAWTRWMKAGKHGLTTVQMEVFELLRKIISPFSYTKNEFHVHV